MPDDKDVKEPEDSSSPELKAALEGSAPQETEQQTPDTQTPTAEPKGESQEQEEQPEEEQRVPYSRFKEKVDEANWYKEQFGQQLQRQQSQQQYPQPQPQDPYAGYTPEEKVFWQEVDKQAEKKAQQYVDQNVRPIIDAGRQEIARMSVAHFRQRYPDVKPNSPEEIEIAQRISQGYVPDDAYWATMGPRGVQKAESKAKQQVKQQITAKKQANVETKSLPTNAPLPSGKKMTQREEIEKNWNDIMGE